MKLRSSVTAGLAILFAVLFVYAAWVPDKAVLMLSTGGVILALGIPYNLLRKDTDPMPFVVGVLFMIAAVAVENAEVKGITKVLSIAYVLAVIMWLLARRRQRNLRHPHTKREQPPNWAGTDN